MLNYAGNWSGSFVINTCTSQVSSPRRACAVRSPPIASCPTNSSGRRPAWANAESRISGEATPYMSRFLFQRRGDHDRSPSTATPGSRSLQRTMPATKRVRRLIRAGAFPPASSTPAPTTPTDLTCETFAEKWRTIARANEAATLRANDAAICKRLGDLIIDDGRLAERSHRRDHRGHHRACVQSTPITGGFDVEQIPRCRPPDAALAARGPSSS